MGTLPSIPTRQTAASEGLSSRCVRIKRDGNPCGNSACIGTTLCAAHGGTSPAIRAAAAARMVEMQPEAMNRIHEFLKPVSEEDAKRACALCGRGMPHDPNLVLRASLAVLDRTGLGPTAKLELEVKDDTAWVEYCTEDEVDALHEIKARCMDRMGQEPLDVPARLVDQAEATN